MADTGWLKPCGSPSLSPSDTLRALATACHRLPLLRGQQLPVSVHVSVPVSVSCLPSAVSCFIPKTHSNRVARSLPACSPRFCLLSYPHPVRHAVTWMCGEVCRVFGSPASRPLTPELRQPTTDSPPRVQPRDKHLRRTPAPDFRLPPPEYRIPSPRRSLAKSLAKSLAAGLPRDPRMPTASLAVSFLPADARAMSPASYRHHTTPPRRCHATPSLPAAHSTAG